MSDRGHFGDPHSERLGRLTDAMLQTLEAHPECGSDVTCVIFLQDDEKGGLQMHGYDGDDSEQSTAAIADILYQLRAIFAANGVTLMFAPIGGDG